MGPWHFVITALPFKNDHVSLNAAMLRQSEEVMIIMRPTSKAAGGKPRKNQSSYPPDHIQKL
jgi:hypothetical protein